MKKNKYLLIIGLLLVVITSCSTTQTFVVHGTPGTVITKSNGTQLAVVDQNGQVEITMNRKEGYNSFLLAQTPGSDLKVPFALDYENHNRTSLYNMAMIPCVVSGLGCSICGIAAAITENRELALVSLLFDGVFSAIAIPVVKYSDFPINMDYDYLKHQNTNNDLIR